MEYSASQALLYGIPAGFLVAAIVWIMPSAEYAGFWVIVIVTYVIALGRFTHVVAGSNEAFLLILNGDITVQTGLFGLLLPTLLGNIIGGTGLFAMLAHRQVREEILAPIQSSVSACRCPSVQVGLQSRSRRLSTGRAEINDDQAAVFRRRNPVFHSHRRKDQTCRFHVMHFTAYGDRAATLDHVECLVVSVVMMQYRALARLIAQQVADHPLSVQYLFLDPATRIEFDMVANNQGIQPCLFRLACHQVLSLRLEGVSRTLDQHYSYAGQAGVKSPDAYSPSTAIQIRRIAIRVSIVWMAMRKTRSGIRSSAYLPPQVPMNEVAIIAAINGT